MNHRCNPSDPQGSLFLQSNETGKPLSKSALKRERQKRRKGIIPSTSATSSEDSGHDPADLCLGDASFRDVTSGPPDRSDPMPISYEDTEVFEYTYDETREMLINETIDENGKSVEWADHNMILSAMVPAATVQIDASLRLQTYFEQFGDVRPNSLLTHVSNSTKYELYNEYCADQTQMDRQMGDGLMPKQSIRRRVF
mmetsp:Transcript_117841/g.231213  ORF Transcript_117841/g.231213 Transcript_117841/m.231213 type:complete len:198 (+) Transcript_117841:80-673(+)